MTPNDIVLFALRRSNMILHGMVDEFTHSDWLHRATEDSNPAAWIVGHLITVERAALVHLTDKLPELPDADFTARHAKGAQPGQGGDYGDVMKLMPLFDAQRNLLIDRVATLSASDFDRPIDSPLFKVLGEFLAVIPAHTMLHSGQISTIRRSLGKPPIF